MKINLEKVRYKNVLSTGANPVEIELNTHHTTLICGKNGSAKSTFIEAVMFALFGRPYRDINKNQLINSINKKGLLVELWFNINGKTNYYIKRGIKPNVFAIEVDGVEIDEDSNVRDFQKELEQDILKMNYKTAKQIVALGTAGFTPFMQLKTYERRQIIDDLLDIEVFSKMAENNKKQTDLLATELDQVTNSLLFKSKEIGIRQQFLKDHQRDKNKQIAVVTTKITDINKHIVAAEAKRDKRKLDIEKLEQARRPFLKDDLMQAHRSKSEYELECKNINKGIRFFEEHAKCPTCKQHIDDEFITSKLQQYTTELNSATGHLDATIEVIKQLDQTKERNLKIDSKQKELLDEISIANVHINSWAEAIVKCNAEIEKLTAEHAAIDTSNLDTLILESKRLTKIKTVTSNKKHCHGIVNTLLKDSGIKARIISQYIPVINTLINNFLGIMEANYKFELDNEFNEKILSRGREEFSYMSFSQGEKMRIDLAILFTWRELIKLKNSASFNILVMDEIMDGAADQDCVDCIMRIINDLKDNVFIISHNDKIDPTSFSHHINMVKIGNFSTIDKSV